MRHDKTVIHHCGRMFSSVHFHPFGQTCWASALHGPATCLLDFDLQCAGTSKWPCRPIMLRFGWTAESLCRCLPRLKRCFAAAWPVKGGQVLWFDYRTGWIFKRSQPQQNHGGPCKFAAATVKLWVSLLEYRNCRPFGRDGVPIDLHFPPT